MGGICSKSSYENDRKEEEGKFIGVQVAEPLSKDGVPQNGKTDGSVDTVNKNGENRISEKQKDGHKLSISERVLGSKRIQKIKSIVGGTQGAQKAAGWPSWLTSVASEAIQGWVPRSVDSYEMLDKVSTDCYVVIPSCFIFVCLLSMFITIVFSIPTE